MKLYRPSPSVAALRAFPVALFLIVTVAAGMTAPCSSRTTPESVAVGVCPKDALTVNSNNIAANRLFVFIAIAPFQPGLAGWDGLLLIGDRLLFHQTGRNRRGYQSDFG
jgi:hypothetical protein